MLPEPILNKFYSVKFSAPGSSDISVDNDVKPHILVDFTDDDTLLANMLKQAIAVVEKYCSIKIIPGTVTVIGDFFEEFELPYGPVTTFTSSSKRETDGSYTALTTGNDYLIDGDDYKRYIPYFSGRTKLIYASGYTVTPDDLKLAILNEIAFRYELRGDATNRYAAQNVGICDAARALALSFKRMQWI